MIGVGAVFGLAKETFGFRDDFVATTFVEEEGEARKVVLEAVAISFGASSRLIERAGGTYTVSRNGAPAVTIDEGESFLAQDGDRLDLPGITQMLTEAALGVPLGARGDKIAWPYPLEGVALDQLDFGTPNAAVKLFSEERAATSATIRNARTGDALRFDFDPQSVDTLGVWLTRGGWRGYHHLAVEPGIGAP
ncbi:MAG: hypothetical protein HC788_09300, partial [Sphingopyxis sp.]|nr:hypothetical protein [Sphingopyxis sp.]